MLKPNPAARHQEYSEYIEQWTRCRDAYSGSDAIKGKREAYLPKLDVHLRGTKGDERYNAYIRRAYFYNATKRTVVGLAGLIHQTAPSIAAPEEPWLDDVTLTGISAQLQALLSTEEVILVGRAGMLVDMTQEVPSRPFWVPYVAENIVNWRVEYALGKPYLSLVVLRECVYEAVEGDPFGTVEVEQYRALSLRDGVYVQNVWRKESSDWVMGPDIIPERKGKPLTFIPFTFMGPTSSSPCVEAPPVMDLVDLNISHYQTTANLEHGLGFLGTPALVLIGAVNSEGKPIEYGASAAITLPMGGDAKVLQASGEMMGALERAEERKRKLLSVLGAKLLEEQPGAPETATAVSMRHSGEHASLKTVAQAVEYAFTWLLKVSLWWLGTEAAPQDVEANFELNKDFFSSALGPEDIKALVLLLQANAISFETFWKEFTEGGHGRPGVSAEEEQAAIGRGNGTETMPNEVVGNPYEVKQLKGEWVVTKNGTDDVIPGGKHGSDRAKALKHFTAMEAAYHKEQK